MVKAVGLGQMAGEPVREWGVPKDTGCSYFTSCLSCPLPACRYDVRTGMIAVKRAALDARILELVDGGMRNGEVARALGINVRTVQRAKERAQRMPENSLPQSTGSVAKSSRIMRTQS